MAYSIEDGQYIFKVDGKDVAIPEEVVSQVSQAREEYLREKYGEELQLSSRLQPDEMPEEYRERLHSLYPRADQIAYIDGLFEVGKAGKYAMHALQSYHRGEPLAEEVNLMYPINPTLYSKDPESITLNMSPLLVNNLIYACNLAKYHVEKTGNNLIESARERFRKLISNKIGIDSLPTRERISISKNLKKLKHLSLVIGASAMDELVTSISKEEYTHESMGILTPEVSETFDKISKYDFSSIRPSELYISIVPLVFALDDLDIYLGNYTDIQTVYDRVFK